MVAVLGCRFDLDVSVSLLCMIVLLLAPINIMKKKERMKSLRSQHLVFFSSSF